MAGAEKPEEWPHRQRVREERMRYEVLAMVYAAGHGRPDAVLRVSGFAEGLGVWREELFRVVEFLDSHGYLSYRGAGPEVSITRKGIDYLEKVAARRRSIRE